MPPGEVLLGDLRRAGFDVTSEHEESDAIIINTCAFVEDAKSESLEVGGLSASIAHTLCHLTYKHHTQLLRHTSYARHSRRQHSDAATHYAHTHSLRTRGGGGEFWH